MLAAFLIDLCVRGTHLFDQAHQDGVFFKERPFNSVEVRLVVLYLSNSILCLDFDYAITMLWNYSSFIHLLNSLNKGLCIILYEL